MQHSLLTLYLNLHLQVDLEVGQQGEEDGQ